MAGMIRMLALCLMLALWVGGQSLSQQNQSVEAKVFEEIDSILNELSEITGFKKIKPVRTATMSRPELKRFLEKRIQEVADPKEIRAEEIALKKFGFIPNDFDLKSSTIDLMTEQAAAFYDYREKKLYLLEGGAEEMQQPALVHELAHALADQHFNLEKFVNPKQSDDSVLARMAVVEGQATWLMSEFVARKLGQSLQKSPSIVEMMSRAADGMSARFPVLNQVPLYLRETLLFPYGKGMIFQQAAITKMEKDAFRGVFRTPPVSTQQILHPDLYFRGIKPVKPPLPRYTKPDGYRVLSKGALGELDHSILIQQYAAREEANRLAPRLKGAAFELLESREGDRFLLLYTSEWGDASTAEEYFRLYQRVLKGKWKSMEVRENSSSQILGQGDDGGFELKVEGSRVFSIEGLP